MNLHKKTLTLTEGLDHYSNTPINKQQTPKPPFKIFLILKLHTNEAWFDWGCAIQFSWLNPTNPEYNDRYWGGKRIKTVFALDLLQYIRED